MCDQHLYQSPVIEVYETADYYNNLTECAFMIFLCNLGLKNYLHGQGFEPTTLDLSSQSGAFDLSATATPLAIPCG